MFFPVSAVVALASLLSAVSAQTYYSANPEDIDLGTKQTWCSNQISSCSLLCLDQKSGGGFTNDCDPDTLVFQCICADNTVPNATEYTQTIPYFLCTYSVENCVQNCGQYDPTCAQNCRTNRVCGASNPTRVTSTGTSGVSKTTTSARPSGTNGGDDVAFDATPSANSEDASNTSSADDDAPAQTGSSGNTPNAGNRLVSVSGSGYALSVMILSVLCGAFVFQF